MPYIAQTRDLTKQYLSYGRILSDYRPVALTLYAPGTVVQLVPLEQQVYPDESTVVPTVTVTGQQNLVVGVVTESWPGFAGVSNAIPQPNQPPSFLSPSNAATARGTAGVTCVVQGFHPSVLVDLTAGAAVVDGTILVPSTTTPGTAQGATAQPAVGMGIVGVAMLPTGLTLGTGALTQATESIAFAGTALPVGTTATVTVTLPGGGPSFSFSTTSTAVQAANAFATAIRNLMLANTSFTQYFVPSGSGSPIVLTVAAPPGPSFLYNTPSGSQFPIALSGSVGNSVIVTATSSNIGLTITPSGFTGGLGYQGTVPAFITGAVC